MRYKLIVEYDGTDFHGWQIQARERTVQGVLEEAVAQLFGETSRVAAAGRTDAGVHAAGQVAAFSTAKARPAETVLSGLNALTPPDLTIRSVGLVDEAFDPRRDARSRASRTSEAQFEPNTAINSRAWSSRSQSRKRPSLKPCRPLLARCWERQAFLSPKTPTDICPAKGAE